jgi:amidohydrolase
MPHWLPDEEVESLLRLRREFHEHPELSWKETRTSTRVTEELEALGLRPQHGIAGTGVVVDIGTDGPYVALRADMDALPIQEESGLPFSSKVPGVMHACGHDAHTACLLTVAKRLVASPPPFGRVRLLFQPAEEVGAGAPKMLEEGALAIDDVRGIYGIHFWSQLETGVISVVPGPMMGSVDQFTIDVKGKGGHGAAPHECADPLVAAAHLVTSLQSIVSRRLDPLKPAVVSVGRFQSGTAFNVIPDTAHLLGTVRTMDRDTWEAIPGLLEQIASHTVAAFGCEATVQMVRAMRPLINHPDATALAQTVAKELVEPDKLQTFQTMAGEDFAAYLEQIPGCFLFVGAGGNANDAPHQPPHHNPKFTLDEEAFPLAVRLLEGCARQALQDA